MAIDWTKVWQTAIPSLIGLGGDIYSNSQQQQIGPISPEQTMSPQERALLEHQLAYSQTVTPLEMLLAQTTLPLEAQFRGTAIPLAMQQLPQLYNLESAQMGAQQQLIPQQTALTSAQLGSETGLVPLRGGMEAQKIGAKQNLLSGQTPAGFDIGKSYANSPFVSQAIEQAGQRFQNKGLLRSGVSDLGTKVAAGRVGAELEGRKRQEQLGLLGLGLA